MPDGRDGFFRRIVRRVVRMPAVVIPGALGAFSGLMGLISQETFLLVMGVTGIALAAGVALTNLILRPDELVRDDLLDEQNRARDQHLERIDELARAASRDDDRELFLQTQQLKVLYDRMRSANTPEGFDVPAELGGRMRELYQSCITSITQVLKLNDATRQMATTGVRQEMLRRRRQVVDEVELALQQIALTLDKLQAASVTRETAGEAITALREELDLRLSVAHRVEQRMRDLESGETRMRE
jgi:hypothetical protein